MKLHQLIKELETIYALEGDIDVCLNGDVWRQEVFSFQYGESPCEVCCIIREIQIDNL